MKPPAFDSVRSWASYEGAARELIHLFKYERVRPLGGWFARRMSGLGDLRADVVIPVPLARVRERERGFNQSLEVARILARRNELPLATKCLSRLKETSSQAGLTGAERRQNLQGAFRAKNVKGSAVLLVDDVFTTGATAAACAGALKRGGANAVHVLTVARAELRAHAALSATVCSPTASLAHLNQVAALPANGGWA